MYLSDEERGRGSNSYQVASENGSGHSLFVMFFCLDFVCSVLFRQIDFPKWRNHIVTQFGRHFYVMDTSHSLFNQSTSRWVSVDLDACVPFDRTHNRIGGESIYMVERAHQLAGSLCSFALSFVPPFI